MTLSSAELKIYSDEGLVIPSFSLSSEQLGALRDDCARVIADNPEVGPDAYINTHFEKSTKRAEGVTGGDRIRRSYGELPEVLDMVEQIIGPDIGSCLSASMGAGVMHADPAEFDGAVGPSARP
jgi:hypothetical protein